MNSPALVVHYKISDVTDLSIAGLDVVAVQSLGASQIGIVVMLGVTARARFTTGMR
jgi:hypothetical protein